MCCRAAAWRRFAGTALAAVLLMALLVVAGCGRKGDPLPPLPDPDAVSDEAAAPSEQDDPTTDPEGPTSDPEGGEASEPETEEDDGEADPPAPP